MSITRTLPAYALTAVAGWIDTVGILLFFEELQIFPTYMSGNTTRLFVSAQQGDLRRLFLFGAEGAPDTHAIAQRNRRGHHRRR